MIQGYAIYLRTHRETGKQYGGMCWWTKPRQTAEKACERRWKREDKDGIRGLFGGFDSRIVLSEIRANAPEMSDGLYRIRIAVDEAKVVDGIPAAMRLNTLLPLMQLNSAMLREDLARCGGRIGGHNISREDRVRAGRLGGRIGGHRTQELYPNLSAENGRKNAINKIGVCGRSPEKMSADGRKGGLSSVASGHLANLRTSEHQAAAGRCGGRVGGRVQGRRNATNGNLEKARQVYQLNRFLKTVAWG